ncbi:hypothetical protein KGF54_003418 [Candida jiufengensis]|uniref:uncharacterized protein n=1 Tax=Candida jiufengensis TaxID=497108 RepID=UPI002224194A|nr:uncharacterized protein KGF54_003418 [Candida jiufengensis]KAI5952551.1 hypothetical protein KGF54_003418 [Candida jiufengensis]
MSDIPKSIITALTKYQDRPFILYLEKDLIKFIKNSILGNIKQPEYVIQAQYLKNSYYRLLSHQLCHYYQLQHWNNQSNEIVVTPTENFDYKSFILIIEDENNEFMKISDIAHQYQAEHSPNTFNNQELNDESTSNKADINDNSSNGIINNKDDTSNNIQVPSDVNKNVNSDKPTKPKFIVKKIINKPQTPEIDSSKETNIEKKLTNLKINDNDNKNNESSIPQSEDSDVSITTDSTNKSTIESQRASKEALYKKLRDEIFLKEDEDQEGDDEEEEEDLDDAEDVDSEESNSKKGQNSETDNHTFTKDHSHKSKYHNNNNNYRYKHNNNQYYNSHPNHHHNHHNQQQQQQHPYQMPIQFTYPQMYSPQGLSPTIPQGPILYNPYYPNQPQHIIPPQGFTTYTTFPIHHQPPYDKETERRILNNPYIILPGDDGSNDRFTNNSGNIKQQQKLKKIYNNNNSNGYTNGNTNGNYKGNNGKH